MIKYSTAGESHGKCLMGIVEGLPANLKIDFDFINGELKRRQGGFGRGDRMKIESDKVEFVAGVRGGLTTGAPIGFIIENHDHKNWQDIVGAKATKLDEKKLTAVRPGHADLAGCIKYNQTDARNILERTSARQTASMVVVGAICKLFLLEFGISITSRVEKIGGDIKKAMESGDTLGGEISIKISGMPVGIGSGFSSSTRLEYALMGNLGAIGSVKAVSIGQIDKLANTKGSEFHDSIYLDKDKKIYRKTNNAGGIEGGISNGEDIDIYLKLKPIPSVPKGINSVDIEKMVEAKSANERGDTVVLEAAAVVAENVAAFVIAEKIKEKFGGDFFDN